MVHNILNTYLREIGTASNIPWVKQPFNHIIAVILFSQKGPLVCLKYRSFRTIQTAQTTFESQLVCYRRVTQTLPPVTDIFGQFLNVCCIFSGETAKDF